MVCDPSKRSTPITRFLVAVAAVGLMIGVRPASMLRGRLALFSPDFASSAGTSSVGWVEPLGSIGAPSGPTVPEDVLSLTSAEEEGADDLSDDAVDSTLPEWGLVHHRARTRTLVILSVSLDEPTGPIRARFGQPPDLDAIPIGLPIRFCRLTC